MTPGEDENRAWRWPMPLACFLLVTSSWFPSMRGSYSSFSRAFSRLRSVVWHDAAWRARANAYVWTGWHWALFHLAPHDSVVSREHKWRGPSGGSQDISLYVSFGRHGNGQLFESQFGVTWPPWVLATPHVKIEIEQKIETRALLMRKAASTQAVPWPHV